MRYFTALNIKDTSAYSNSNARLLYLHMCCSMDYKTRQYTCSSRALALELNMTHKAVRCALDALLAASLIRAQDGAQPRAQATTYIISDLTYSKGTSEGTSEGTHINNNIINFSLARACARFLEDFKIDIAAQYWGMERSEAYNWVCAFLDVQKIRQREGWRDEQDAWTHMLDWTDKKRKVRKAVKAEAPQEPQEPESSKATVALEPCPPGWSLDDWQGIKRLVASGSAAPAVIETYNQALATMQLNE